MNTVVRNIIFFLMLMFQLIGCVHKMNSSEMNSNELSERQFQATNSEDFNYLKTGAAGYKELWDYVQTNVLHDRPNPIIGEIVQVIQMNDKTFTHYYVATQKKGTCFVVVIDNENNKILGHRWIEIALKESIFPSSFAQ